MKKIPLKERVKMTELLAELHFQILYNGKILFENEDLDLILEVVEECFYDAYDYFENLVDSRVPTQYLDKIKTSYLIE